MSISLPYPNMSFVPLDVLTAEELNHVVANYTAIAAAFPVATANIADGSITNTKLSVNWTNVNDLYYKAGDVVSETYSMMALSLNGFLTSSNQDIYVSIPMAKRLDNITSATITSLVCNGRCQGAYLTNLGGSGANIASEATTVETFISKATNCIVARFIRSGGWGATNNSTVSLAVGSLDITLN